MVERLNLRAVSDDVLQAQLVAVKHIIEANEARLKRIQDELLYRERNNLNQAGFWSEWGWVGRD